MSPMPRSALDTVEGDSPVALARSYMVVVAPGKHPLPAVPLCYRNRLQGMLGGEAAAVKRWPDQCRVTHQ